MRENVTLPLGRGGFLREVTGFVLFRGNPCGCVVVSENTLASLPTGFTFCKLYHLGVHVCSKCCFFHTGVQCCCTGAAVGAEPPPAAVGRLACARAANSLYLSDFLQLGLPSLRRNSPQFPDFVFPALGNNAGRHHCAPRPRLSHVIGVLQNR